MRQLKVQQVPLFVNTNKKLPVIHTYGTPVKMHKMISTEEWLKKQQEIKRKEEKRKLLLSTPKSEGTMKVYCAKPRTPCTSKDKRKYWKQYYARNGDKIRNYQREYYSKKRLAGYEPDYQI